MVCAVIISISDRNKTFVNNGTFRAGFIAGYYGEQYEAEAYK